jgi:hypothetical protein
LRANHSSKKWSGFCCISCKRSRNPPFRSFFFSLNTQVKESYSLFFRNILLKFSLFCHPCLLFTSTRKAIYSFCIKILG